MGNDLVGIVRLRAKSDRDCIIYIYIYIYMHVLHTYAHTTVGLKTLQEPNHSIDLDVERY
jgi:hypothetical protein